MKRLLIILCALLLLGFGTVLAESLPLEGEAPYPPVLSALSEDGLSYDDGSLSIRIERDVAFDTNIYYVYVRIQDPSQLRTALAGRPGTAVTMKAAQLASRNQAVLALNGDYFNGHHSGIAYRQGKQMRNVPAYTRDLCIVDEKGDLHIIASSTNKEQVAQFEAYTGEIIQCFCFGPGLIIDGEKAVFQYQKKTSCGYPTRAQRLIFCQTGPLEYLFLATEGPEQNQPGLSVPECVSLLEELGTVKQAYNMDGGNSVHIILCGNRINAPESKTRDLCDIIYFATLIH